MPTKINQTISGYNINILKNHTTKHYYITFQFWKLKQITQKNTSNLEIPSEIWTRKFFGSIIYGVDGENSPTGFVEQHKKLSLTGELPASLQTCHN